MPPTKKYWLLKSEPESFSIDDLARAPQQTTCWSGVRNYQARNFMRDEMHLGDEVLYYHSNAEPSAVVGTAVVVREAYPDHTQFDAKSDYFDPKATPAKPVWQMVDIRLQQVFPAALSIERLRTVPALKNMELLRRGSRLSVQPVSKAEFEAILRLAKDEAPAKKKSTQPRRVTRAKK
ncbi:MAG: EVE domain-containing protein [Planctomycetes bacterium]|nr:EVE domain-containing protein [Planctomycetota bacterium]